MQSGLSPFYTLNFRRVECNSYLLCCLKCIAFDATEIRRIKCAKVQGLVVSKAFDLDKQELKSAPLYLVKIKN